MNIKDKVLSVAMTYATGKMLDDPDIAYSSFGEFNFSINLYTKNGDQLFDTYIYVDCKNEDCCAIDNYNGGDISVIEGYVEYQFNNLASWASEISKATIEQAASILDQSAEVIDMSESTITSNFGNGIKYTFDKVVE